MLNDLVISVISFLAGIGANELWHRIYRSRKGSKTNGGDASEYE